MLQRRLALALACAVALVAAPFTAPAGAAPLPGSLDPGFGTGGATVTDLSFYDSGFDTVADAAVAPDGRIVVAGHIGQDFARSLLVGRYRRDGTLDTTFGGDGVVATDASSAPEDWQDNDDASAVAVQPDGKVVAVGGTYDLEDEDGLRGALAVRYRTDGTLDPTFGDDGIVVEESVGGFGAVAALPDGRLLVAGGDTADNAVFVARYLPDGRLDPTFGVGGVGRVDTGRYSGATGLVVQPNGRIVLSATAYSRSEPFQSDVAVVRFLAHGVPDPSSGSGGVVVSDLGSPRDVIESVALQPDGRVVVAGSVGEQWNQRDVVVARYRRNGTLDRSFGAGGVVRTAFAEVPGRLDDGAHDLLVQADGRILVAGSANQSEDRNCSCRGREGDIGLLRYRPDGSLDPTFGTGGRVVTDLGRVELAMAIELGPGNRVVVAGVAAPPDNQADDNFVARYRVGRGLR